MTFLEAALKILSREGKPLHFKDLTERAMSKKLLTFVGRTPEVTMQTQLTAAVKKAPGNPFVRVKPGVFGLLRYPELPPEEPEAPEAPASPKAAASRDGERGQASEGGEGAEGRGRRRRRRGGRGRGRDEAATTTSAENGAAEAAEGGTDSDEGNEGNEPAEPKQRGGLSAAARAAALAETGVLEGDDEEGSSDAEGDDLMADDEDVESAGSVESSGAMESAGAGHEAAGAESDELEAGFAGAPAEGGDADDDDDDGDEEGGGEEGGASATGEGGAPRAEGEGSGRRRRRRRRRRGGAEGFGEGGPRPSEPGAGDSGGMSLEGGAGAPAGEGAAPSGEERPAEGGGAEDNGPRRIMTPVDAAFEILRGQAPGRGMHVRQIAESASRRRLVHGEPNEAWRVMRAGLAAEPRERLRAGQRPRVRSAGAGLFSLARRPPDAELERAELVFGEARRALRERTIASLERRIADLSGPAFEALARVLIQREGFGPATFVKRVEGTVYVEALRGRGARPSKTLIALRSGGGTAGRRAIGELRAGIRMRNQDEGLLMLGGRLGEDAIGEWKQDGRPIEIADGHAMAETCIRHGLGVLNAQVSVDFVDADFFAELAEG